MTSNTSTSIQSVVAEQAPKAATPPPSAAAPSPPQSSVLGWAATKVGACLQVLASPAAASLMIASVFLVVRYKNKRRSKPVMAAKPVTRSMSLALMHGGGKAIQRFKELNRASVEEADLKKALDDIRMELGKPELSEEELNKAQLSKEDLDKKCINFVDLYAKIGIFEMTKKEEEVITLLEVALDKAKKLAKDPGIDTHTTHELKLLLVEMLIYEGNYNKALELLQKDVSSTADARVPLYKAVIYTIQSKDDLAKTHFNEYMDIRNRFHRGKFYKDAPMHLHVSDFQEFVALVKNIKKVIETAHSGQTPPSQPVQERVGSTQKEPRANSQQVSKTQGKTPDSTSGGKTEVEKDPSKSQVSS